jgi:quercetin 2,3-dioxygenase
MIRVRHASERGHADHGWLDTRHTFSFADYYDVEHMGFRALRVINEDRVRPGAGFGRHPHRDMEILTWVLDGALEHQDSTGARGVIRPGTVQRMSAGSGVVHSEYNHSQAEPVHFLQIWIQPSVHGAAPRYEDREFPAAGRADRLQLLASPDGAEGSLDIYQDARVYVTELAQAASVSHRLAPGRHAWVQVARGAVTLNGAALAAGDGAAVSEEAALDLQACEPSQVLVFDLA